MAKVLLYELNEVPWLIIDRYLTLRPQSNLAALLKAGRSETTVNEDPHHLSPWNTWPTFHTGVFSADHNSIFLGQDPETFRGENFWEVAERAGLKVGLFGVMQTWPARRFRNGGFYVPDTFAQDPGTYPRSLEAFQEFNLAMTTELGFSPDRKLSKAAVTRAGMSLVRLGLTVRSVRKLVKQLVRERQDQRFKAARSIFQVVPAFDLYWRLHQKERPEVSVFFTNHVAGIMHRFWGDFVPGYAEEYDYVPDEVFATFVTEAMDIFDEQLGKLMAHVDTDGDTTLVVASSMGQDAIPYKHVDATHVVEHPATLARKLELEGAVPALSMYPLYAFTFDTTEQARRASETLAAVVMKHDSAPLFCNLEVKGNSLLYGVVKVLGESDDAAVPRSVEIPTSAGVREIDVEEIGIEVAHRMGGGNTGYHVPEGIYISYGKGVDPDQSREVFDVREAKSRILQILGASDASVGR